MITTTYKCRLKQREPIAEGTMAFHFEKPSGFVFKAGQTADLTLLDPAESDAEGNVRTFSIASAPREGQLMFATRMRDTAFKRVLRNVPLDSEVQIEGPMGSFTLHNNQAKPAVFLAGGIGITPFSSIVRQAAADKLGHKLYLFYSNRRPEDAAFMKDLQALETQNPNFHFVPTMTEIDKSRETWKGETGFINGEMLVKQVPQLQGPIYYVAGPPAMVAAMREMLVSAGIDQDDIRSEDFAGY
jgi:ferredoxin-NADP reductase